MPAKHEPTVQLSLIEGEMELRLVARLRGDEGDMTGDEAGTWLMGLWERVRVAAALMAEYGFAPAPIPAPTAPAEPAIILQEPALNPPAAPSPRQSQSVTVAPYEGRTKLHQKGQADREIVLEAIRASERGLTPLLLEEVTGLSKGVVNWQLQILRRQGRIERRAYAGGGSRWWVVDSPGEQPRLTPGSRASAERTRAAVLAALTESKSNGLPTVAELAKALATKVTTVSYHLYLLRDEGKVESVPLPDHPHRACGWRLLDHSDTAPVEEEQDTATAPPSPSGAREETLEHWGLAAADGSMLAGPLSEITPHSSGKVFLMLSGVARPQTAERIREALLLKELRWPSYEPGAPLTEGLKEINRGDVALVLVSRFNRDHGRFAREARMLGKPVISLPKGYSLTQVVHAIDRQWPPQWRRSPKSLLDGNGSIVPEPAGPGQGAGLALGRS